MAKSTTKPSDRGRNNPEPGPAPGGRAEQRDTKEQLRAGTAVSDDPALEFEREEQERLPPRGTGAQDNQGGNRGQTARPDQPSDEAPAPAVSEGEQSGGTRGPSNDNRDSRR